MGPDEYRLLLLLLLFGSVALAAGAGGWRFLRLLRAAPSRRAQPPLPESRPPDLRDGLRKTRAAFTQRLLELVRARGELDETTVAALERMLYGADLGVRSAEELLDAARRAAGPADVPAALRERALQILRAAPVDEPTLGRPHVILVVGVNGSGKTTSIGKLALRYRRAGKRVLVGAADTYRAAAIEQLGVWARRADAEFVHGEPGGDPAAVAFDAVRAAASRNADVVLLDTAGRLQTDTDLMDQLAKIARVVRKEIPDAPHEVVLVLDANTGQNAIRQAQEFQRAVSVDRILLAKLDGTAKGGVVLGIALEVGVPVRYIGLGETIDDLADFDAEAFVDALFDTGSGFGNPRREGGAT